MGNLVRQSWCTDYCLVFPHRSKHFQDRLQTLRAWKYFNQNLNTEVALMQH